MDEGNERQIFQEREKGAWVIPMFVNKGRDFVEPLLEHGDGQIRPVAEVTVQGTSSQTGTSGDFLKRHFVPALCKEFRRRHYEPLAPLLGIFSQ
ncbi:MAG: hypothetical protein QHC67_12945 [Sphingobium sp.]|nr:hypothetical protein [Sphingobium sp.]